jgi:uncharacterized protein (DUF1800 family)
MSLEAAIALNRFGVGARPDDLSSVGDPRTYLKRQLARPQAALIDPRGLPSSGEAFVLYVEGVRQRRAALAADRQTSQPPQMPGEPGMQGRDANVPAMAQRAQRLLGNEVAARVRHGAATDAGFLERWTLFWANHFTMAANGAQKVPFVGPFEREAIRPHVLGRFVDLLTASTTHPGMLVYLDQAQSIGPNSPAGTRQNRNGRVRGLNENLAREILELHTVGTASGYTQADVTEFARALTGWTIATERTARFTGNAPAGTTVFAPLLHEPGTRTVLGRRYSQTGARLVPAILSDLAAHPATARKIATKVARHFIADTPPASLVDRLEASFNTTGGDLARLAETLVDSHECWAPQQAKLKTPLDFLLSTLRASGRSTERLRDLRQAYEQLGQPAFGAPSPEGWPDDAASWAGPDAILKRVDWAGLVAEQIALTTDAVSFAESCLGASLSDTTRTAIRRAETRRQGITLALMSPEFQRR